MRRPRNGANRPLIAAAVVAPLAYLTWRLGWTLGGPGWLSVPLLAAETLLVLRFLLSVVNAAVAPTPLSDPASVCDAGDGPDVELLVPAGLADREELVRTLLVASVGDAARIRVLDHRDRPRIRRTAQRLGAEYEVHQVPAGSRPAALVEAARAGSRTEVLAWVDAGDVIVPGFLDLASMLVDPARPRLAVVQSSVDLINADSLLHLSPRHDERALENEVVGPSLSRSGAAEWIGSGSLFRADAIDSIGGLADASAPTHRAAMRLARSGWGVRWSTPPSVRTEAPDSLDAYLLAEGTTAHEDWELLTGAESPLLPIRTGARRRTAQLHASTAVLDGLARLTALSVLVATLLTGAMPVSGPLLVVAAAFCAQLALRTAAAVSLGRGTVAVGDTTRHGLRTMGVHVLGLVRRPRYPVTAHKGGLATLGRLRLTTTMLVLVDLALLARVLAFAVGDLLPSFESDGARFLAMAAAVWTIVAMVDVLHLLVGRVQRRGTHRQVTDLVAELDGQHCKVVDLTPRGIGLLVADRSGARSPSRAVTARLDIPRLDGTTTRLSVRLRIRHIADQVDPDSGRHRAGASFIGLDDQTRDVLTEYCALTAEQRDAARDRIPTTSPDELAVSGPGPARRALAVGNVAAILVAGLVVAAGPVGAAPIGGGSLTGRVLAPDGQPASGICVHVSQGPTNASSGVDVTGSFELTDLAEGTYEVAAVDCVRNDLARTYAPSTVLRADAAEFRVGGGAVDVGDITMQPLGTVHGTVTDEAGTPLPGICASFVAGPTHEQDWFDAGRTDDLGVFDARVPADVDGTISLRDCTPAPVRSDTWYPGVSDMAGATTVRLSPNDTSDLGNTVMATGAVVQGLVTDGAGAPQPNVCVSAQDTTGRDWRYAGGSVTGADGTYRFVVAPGRYSIWLNDCGSTANLVSQWYPGAPAGTDPPPTVDIALPGATLDATMQRGGRISGRLTDSRGQGARGMCVSLHDATDLDNGNGTWDRVNDDGTWVTSGVDAGDYLVRYSNCNDDDEWAEQIHPSVFPDSAQRWSFEDAQPVHVELGATTAGIDDTALRAVRVHGTVTSGGAAAADVCIGGANSDQTEADGMWRARALPDQDVTFTFSDCRPGRGLVQQHRTVRAGEGDDVTLDVDLPSGATTSVTGSLHNAAGANPSAPTCVVAYVPNELIGIAPIDGDGSFHLDGLADGDYWFGFIGCGGDSDAGPISIHGDPTVYPPMWFPGVPIVMARGTAPHPAWDDIAPTAVRSGSTPPVLDQCLGVGCGTTTTTTAPEVPPSTSPETPIAPPTVSSGPAANPSAAPTPRPPSGLFGTRRISTPSLPTTRRLPLKASNPSRTSATTGAAVANVGAPTTAPTTVATADPATSTPTDSTAPIDGNAAAPTGDEVAAIEPFRTVPPDRQGFPWRLLGGTALVAGAAIALIVVWSRRHPAMG